MAKLLKAEKTKATKENPLKLRLFYDHIITTCRTKDVSPSGIILNAGKGEVLNRQKVLACGPGSGVEVGEEVELNPDTFPKIKVTPKTHGGYEHGIGPDGTVTVPPVEYIDDIPYLRVNTHKLKWVYEKSV